MDDDLSEERVDEEGETWESDEWEELTDEQKRNLNPEKLKRELAAEYRDGNTDAALSRAQDLGYSQEDLGIA